MSLKKGELDVTTWCNGSHDPDNGKGYGLRVRREDVPIFRGIDRIELICDGVCYDLAITPSFFRKCHELRHRAIGEYLVKRGLTRWPKGNPHKIRLHFIINGKVMQLYMPD